MLIFTYMIMKRNLSDKVSPQLNLNMKTNELEINDLYTVKTEEEMEFYPGHENLLRGRGSGYLPITDRTYKSFSQVPDVSRKYTDACTMRVPLHCVPHPCGLHMQVDLIQLKEEPVNMINGGIPKDPLSLEENISVKSKNVKVENEVITINKGTIKGSTKHCITCKKYINNSVNDELLKKIQ
ncbi:uncharacterized protein LOC142332975 isoform X2 [Lycorma delicatula]|uniref:uncharacterized protein LOC142332975 isoform X2 n=1 Tax=Lycorma delicatula TaxID=130591 RepID=UPI003F50D6F2